MKANNDPLVKDLRRILNKHNLAGAVLLGITDKGYQLRASAGQDVAKCNALGPLLDSDEASALNYDIDVAIMEAER